MTQPFPSRSSVGTAVVCLLWLLVAPLNAQEAVQQRQVEQGPVRLTSSVDRTEARVADPIEWTLRVEAPTGSRVGWPALPEQVDSLELRRSGQQDDIPVPAERARDRRFWTRTFLVESLKAGSQTLPAVEVQVDIPDAAAERQRVTLRSEPLSVSIQSSLGADADPHAFRDIKDIVEVEPPTPASNAWVSWIIGGGCAAGLAVLVAAIYWFSHRQQRPAVWAGKELRRLRRSPADTSAERQQRFAEVVDVVRRFLAERFQPEIVSQTDEEWVAHAEAKNLLDAETRSQVARLMKQHDMSRFAHTAIEAEQLDDAFATAEKIIRSAGTADSQSPSDAAIRNAVQMRTNA